METILVISAHADDAEISMGGTIAQYAKEGKRMINIIASDGAASSPWLQKDFILAQRKKEVDKIARYIGFSETHSLGLPDGKVNLVASKKKHKDQLAALIKKYKPKKIFTHSKFDLHKDHQGTNQLVFSTLDMVDPKKKIDVYVFEVWNITNETRPGMYVDVSKTFHKKVQALRMYKSQWHYVLPLFLPVYYRAFISGLHNNCRYAERFYKIR